jgi:hypothetical protein
MEPIPARIDFHNATLLVRRPRPVARAVSGGIAAAELPAFLNSFDSPSMPATPTSARPLSFGFAGNPPVTARGELVCIADRPDQKA